MPRLSLYRPTHTNDYHFMDGLVREQMTVGGTDIHIHKYLGPVETDSNGQATDTTDVTSIQDLLFLENRDRKYDTSIYTLRGNYRVNDNDFDLSQFGLFLSGDTIFMVFHLNDMVAKLGRKIMVGDVFELPHLKDFYPLDDGLAAALKRFYVVQDANRAAEGFSVTWYPHLWRVKLNPLVDSQEYSGIVNQIAASENSDDTIGDLLSNFESYLNINNAVVAEAEEAVPASGYDTTFIYTQNPDVNDNTSPQMSLDGYLVGDGIPPNSNSVAAGYEFPDAPDLGDYYLRLDYSPNRLFRYDGARWIKIEDAVRTSLSNSPENKTQRSSFTNNTNVRMSDPIAWDVILVEDPYTPEAGKPTTQLIIAEQQIDTNIAWTSSLGVKTYLNGIGIPVSLINNNGLLSISTEPEFEVGSRLEYTVYNTTAPEKQALSSALTPDN